MFSVLPALDGSAVVETEIPVAGLVVFALVCVVISAVLSAGEAALGRVTRSAIDDAVEEVDAPEETARARYARDYRLVEDRLVATAASGFVRTTLDMAAATSLTLVLAVVLDDWWAVLLVSVAAALVVLGLVVGASPRSLGRRRPVAVLHSLAGPMTLVWRLFRPLVLLWRRVRPASPLTDAEARAEMVDDLREMVDSVVESDPFEEEDRAWVRSVFELGQTLTREVMVPRTDMITIDAGTDVEDAMTLHVRSGYSRLPVVGDAVDDVRGILYVKDIVKRVHRVPGALALTVDEVMRPAIFVPETKAVDDLLREMQASTRHIAMAVDEWGGIAGLVTIEDLLEEIVGEIDDEHDQSEPEIEEVSPATGDRHEGLVLRMPAKTPVDEAGELFGLEIDDDDVDTVGGLLAKAIGRLPIMGATGEALGLRMEAERVEGRRKRLSTVLVSRAEENEEDGGAAVVDDAAGAHGAKTSPGGAPAEEDAPASDAPHPDHHGSSAVNPKDLHG